MSTEIDPFAGFTMSASTINWSDPTLTADSISSRLMGYVDHWDLPEYVGMAPYDIEKKILFDARRPNWHGVSKHGKPYYQHMLTLGKVMLPDVDISPWLADFVHAFCLGIGKSKKIFNLIGSQNSGKSFGSCFLAFCIMAIDPERSAVFVASPFDVAADATIYGTVEELWDQLCNAHPNTSGIGYAEAPLMFPWGRKFANRQLEFIPNLPKAGSIVLKGVKHTGKFKGSKAFKSKEVDRGVMLLIIDEVNEIQNHSFLEMVSNLVSQDQFAAVTGQNFKDESDLGGRITEPVGTYGGPTSFDELDVEEDQWWHSAKSSITIRYDGHRSPNILAGRTIYPQLFKIENLNLMRRDYGEADPAYFSQVRSFPIRGTETNSVLSRAKISASRHLDPFFTMMKMKGRVGFCDPAFGGRDKAVFGWAEYGDASVTDGEGSQVMQELLVFKDHMHDLSLVKGATYNEYWFERMRAAGISIVDIVEGSEVSYEDQIAIQCRELCKRHNIPIQCFGYDFSMRPDIVSSMNRMLGFSAQAFDYNQAPEGVFIENMKKNSEDCCKNRCSELAFAAADLFLTKQVRGGSYIETAITQLSRTLYETKNNKYLVEDKKAYKARWQQVSPDRRDVLMGIVGMLHRQGFKKRIISAGGNSRSAFAEINARKLGRIKVGRRL